MTTKDIVAKLRGIQGNLTADAEDCAPVAESSARSAYGWGARLVRKLADEIEEESSP